MHNLRQFRPSPAVPDELVGSGGKLAMCIDCWEAKPSVRTKTRGFGTQFSRFALLSYMRSKSSFIITNFIIRSKLNRRSTV
jgi:hypothetical protein